jgi:transposase
MLGFPSAVKIYLCKQATDMRRSFDTLAMMVECVIKQNPLSGHVFVFRNRRRTAIKILVYDGQGYWLFHKRLSNGKFQWWPQKGDSRLDRLAVHELQVLVWNGNPDFALVSPAWRKV